MCSHYQAVKTRERYRQRFDVEPPSAPSKQEVWPGYVGSFIRRHPLGDAAHETLAQREAVSGLFGLVPHWATDTKITRHTYNARTETVAEKPSFRDAWRKAQHCIIPAEAIYEPDWRSGKAVPTRIAEEYAAARQISGIFYPTHARGGGDFPAARARRTSLHHHALPGDPAGA